VKNSLTPTSHALLGLLNVRSWTTYELAKQVQRSLGWFWPRAERKLYDEPKRLVAAGLATASEEHTGKRPRTVYAITGDGRKALRAWLGEAPQPPSLEFEALVKVFFADGGTIEQLRDTLARVEASAVERRAELRAMVAETVGGTEERAQFAVRYSINALAMRFALDYEELQIRWARWAREQTSTWTSPTDTSDWDWRAALLK
jgi:DNA-binding PadR family transcriptional regulator